ERAHERRRQAELLVLLLTDVARAVVHRYADASGPGGVRATAVPQTPVPHEDAALRHLRRDAVVRLAVVGGVVAQVGTGNDARRAVGLGEVGEGPHRVADGGWVRLRDRDELI